MNQHTQPSIQLGRVESIPTLERHYQQFAFKHPLEHDSETISEDGKFKTRLMRREVFTVEKYELFGGEISIDVTGIKRALVARKLPMRMYRAELNASWVEYVRQYGGCEEDHIAALKAADLRRPGIIVLWVASSNTTLIDGNHRIVRRWREGLTTFDMAAVSGQEIIAGGFVAPAGPEAMVKFMTNAEKRGE